MLRAYSGLYSQRLLLTVLRGPWGMPRIKTKLAMYKANANPDVLFSGPPTFIGFLPISLDDIPAHTSSPTHVTPPAPSLRNPWVL